MTIRRHNPPAVHPPAGRYSHVTVHPLGNGLKRVVLAGQVGVKPDGAIAGDLAAQIEQAWDNLLACLASEKLGPKHLVKIVYFTTVNAGSAQAVARDSHAQARRCRAILDLPGDRGARWAGLQSRNRRRGRRAGVTASWVLSVSVGDGCFWHSRPHRDRPPGLPIIGEERTSLIRAPKDLGAPRVLKAALPPRPRVQLHSLEELQLEFSLPLRRQCKVDLYPFLDAASDLADGIK
jgi:enamine deaminase RidA (YjgF/YER057c/UK114 family)